MKGNNDAVKRVRFNKFLCEFIDPAFVMVVLKVIINVFVPCYAIFSFCPKFFRSLMGRTTQYLDF